MNITRDLKPLAITAAFAALQQGGRVMTMGVGQWDSLLAAAYEQGWILLELDNNEVPVRAYRKGSTS